jgi:hypothetical protein
MMRSRALLVVVGLVGCGPETAVDSAGGSTTGSTTSDVEPTSGASTGVQGDPCACAEPVVHGGDLRLEDLVKYQDKCLVEVKESVDLEGVQDPAQLASLSHLRRVRSLLISDSPGLVDLAPLSCLREVGFWLSLRDNPNLVDLGALAELEAAEKVSLRGLPIEELPGFAASYQGINDLSLSDLPELRDLDALAGWPALHDWDKEFRVTIADLPKLESVAGLAGPIGSASAKTTSDSLDGWPSIELAGLPALATIDGLETLTRGDVTLRGLPAVTDLAPLATLEQADFVTLSGLGITSLAGLGSLTEAFRIIVGGCEDGEEMPALTSLAGIGAMAEIDNLWVVDAPALTDLGAPGSATIEEVYFVDTPALDEAAIAAFTDEVDASYQCDGGIVECTCIGLIPDGLTEGCSQWSGGSAVVGMSEGGAFNGTTAFFGWVGNNVGFSMLALVIADETADLEEVKNGGAWNDDGRPKALLETGRYYNR